MRFKLAFTAASACLAAVPIEAQQPRSDESALLDVVVTARRRDENLQSVPVAVSAISGEHLDTSYTVNTQLLSQLVPALYYNSANPRNTAYTIRGLGSNTLSISAANDGIEPGVGFYVDQVYHGRPATASFDFTDIERVEVLRALPLDAANQPTLATAVIEDERNSTVELGLKTTLLNGRATANVAGYHTVVENYQANVVSNLETAAIRSYPSNVPEVRVRGVEADIAARLFSGFTLRASVAYADGENTDYPAGPCPLEVQTAATVACNLTGVKLAGLSEWAGSLGFDYERPLGGGAFLLHADSNSRSGYNSDTSASQYTWISGYSVTNASIGYRFASNWEVGVFARNLFDEDYITALTIQTGNSGLILGQPSDPRILGVTLRARF